MSEQSLVPSWEIQLFGDIYDLDQQYELCVIHVSYEHGHNSWGWPNERKLLMPEIENSRRPERIKEVLRIAAILCDALNKADGMCPMPEREPVLFRSVNRIDAAIAKAKESES